MDTIVVKATRTVGFGDKQINYTYEVSLPTRGGNCLSPHILCYLVQFAQNLANDELRRDYLECTPLYGAEYE